MGAYKIARRRALNSAAMGALGERLFLGMSDSRRRSKWTRQAWSGTRAKLSSHARQKPYPQVGDDAAKRVGAIPDGFADELHERLRRLPRHHDGMDQILGGVVDAHEQGPLPASGPDDFAVHPEDPSPGGAQFGRDLQRGLGEPTEAVHPPVERGPADPNTEPALEKDREHPVRGQALDVQTDRFRDHVIGEPGTLPRRLPSGGEAATTLLTQEPLKGPQRSVESGWSAAAAALALGVDAAAVAATNAPFFPPNPPLSGRLPDS